MENPNISPEELNKMETVDIVQADERWNTYLLADGMVLKIKCTLIKVKKNPNAHDMEGNDAYLTKTQVLVDCERAKSTK